MVKMAGKRDYYEVLGVERSASGKAIADAYRKLAIKYHPDKNPGDDEAVAMFKTAAEAFEVLSDKDKRARYDRHGHAAFDGSSRGREFSDVNDIFSAFGDIFGDSAFGDLFGGGRRRANKGGDVRCDVTLDLLEAARGVTKTVEYQRHEACTDCGGSGARAGSSPRAAVIAAAVARSCRPRAFFACRALVLRAMARGRSSRTLVPRAGLRASS